MLKAAPPESLCVLRLSAIGDTCHALAVVRTIQDTWPETRITWIIGRTEAALLGDIPDIEFIIFDKRGGLGAHVELRRKLARRRYDAALCMHASLRANVLIPAIRSPVKIGYDLPRARDFQWLFTNRRIARTQGLHVLDAMRSFAHLLGAEDRPLRWDIPLSEAHQAFAAAQHEDGQPLVVFSPCSSQRSRNYRNWSAENYAAAARHAMRRHDAKVVVTGGNTELEREYSRRIVELCDGRVTDLVGQTSLKQLLAVLAAADVVVCPDSGPAHMATAVRTPVIGLYATSNPDRTGPYLSRHLTVNAYPEACEKYLGRPVDQVRWGQRVRDPGAMGLIRLSAVTARLDGVLDQGS